jgi:Flp pilus assembly protein protease CpaA
MGIVVFGLLLIVLCCAAYTDWRTGKIRNGLTIPSIGIMCVIRIYYHPQAWYMYVIGIIPAIILYVVAVITMGRKTGGGDILLVLFLGLATGGFVFFIMVQAYVASIILFIYQLLVQEKRQLKQKFAPLLLIAFICFYAESLWISFMVGPM